MKRIVCAVSRNIKSELQGMSYEDMISFVRSRATWVRREDESIQNTLTYEVHTVIQQVTRSLKHLVESLFLKAPFPNTYVANNMDANCYFTTAV